MVQRILSSPEFKMDPLVSIYYYAPACAAINGVVTLFVEIPRMTMNDIWALGVFTLLVNALVAFLLNVSVVLLVCSSLCLSPGSPPWERPSPQNGSRKPDISPCHNKC